MKWVFLTGVSPLGNVCILLTYNDTIKLIPLHVNVCVIIFMVLCLLKTSQDHLSLWKGNSQKDEETRKKKHSSKIYIQSCSIYFWRFLGQEKDYFSFFLFFFFFFFFFFFRRYKIQDFDGIVWTSKWIFFGNYLKLGLDNYDIWKKCWTFSHLVVFKFIKVKEPNSR